MDAAHKLFKNIAILASSTLLLATLGLAQPTLSVPTAVTMSGTGGQSVQVNSSAAGTTEITYTISGISYADDNAGVAWLGVSPSGFTTPSAITFSLVRAPLTGGAHQASVTLTPTAPSGVAAVTITITYNSGTATGGGSNILSATLNGSVLGSTAVQISAASSSQAAAYVTITTTSTTPITISLGTSVSTGNGNWLANSSLNTNTISSTSSAVLTLYANAFNQTSGFTYTGKATITPSTGLALDVNVNFAVGTSTGNGNWSVSSNSATWNYTTNSGLYPSQSPIYVYTSTGSANYYVSVFTDNGGTWLVPFLPLSGNTQYTSLSQVPIGTPFGLTLGSQANNLASGTYTGRAIIYDSSFAQQLQLGVTLTVNGGTSTVLTVNPNPITLNVAVNGGQQSQTVTVTSGAGGNLSINASLPAGITYQLPSSTAIAAGGTLAFTVYANPAGLAANTYSGTMYVYVGSQQLAVTVNMNVGSGSGGTGGTGTTAVAPTNLNFSYQLNTDSVNFISQQKIAITGPAGSWNSSVSTSNGVGWLKISPTSGSSLPNPNDDSTAPVVKCDATGLTAGTYSGTINITTGGGTQSITVSLSVGSSTVLLPTPGSLIFGAQTSQAKPGAKLIYFSGSDSALNPLSLTATANNSWITAVNNDATSILVSVDQTGLTTGTYSGSVSVSQSGAANNPLVIPVVLIVNGGGSGGTGGNTNSNVTVTPATLSFSTGAGASPASQTISVTSASGAAGIAFTAQVTSGASWLAVTPNSGTTAATLTVNVTSGSLASGAYTGNILITPTGGSAFNVPVNLSISTAPAVSASPTSLTFNYSAGGAVPPAQSITVSGNGAAFSATASSNNGWLVVSPTSGATPGTVSVTVNPAGLAANTYSGTVTVAGANGATGSTTINVSLTVTATLPTITKLTNAASYATGSISPGEIITLFAGDPAHPIGPATPVGLTLDSNGNVSNSIGGVQVTVSGYLCPLIYVSATQISAVVPYEVKLFANATVQVKYLGISSNGVSVAVATTVPGLFTANSSGTGPGAISNSNGSPNSPNNPATRGDVVVVYLTGEGETSPNGVTGKVTTVATSGPLTPGPLLQVSVTIGGQPANWTFAGEAPGFVSGVMQLNVVVPTNIAAGDQPILVNFGSTPSQTGVTVSVK